MKKLLFCLLIACGNDPTAPDSSLPPTGPTDDLPVDPGDGRCVAIDWNQVCPPDAGLPPPDAFVPPLDEETKAACCHALLDGQPPKQECGYPPGLCRNGKKDLFCKTAAGDDAKFTLCNP